MNLTELSNLNRLKCSIAGHNYKLVKKVTKHIKHYQCSCCGSQITTNAKGDLISLTEELKLVHFGIETVIIKRNSRRANKKKAVA